MDLSVYIRFVVALIFVLSLIGLIYWCAQRFGLRRVLGDTIAGGRIEIIETKRINTKFQLVLIRRDTACLLYTSPSPRDTEVSRMPSSA